MCGFVAVVCPNQRFSLDELSLMRDRLSHRGPDGKDSWLGRARSGALIGLGHRRLSIIDLSEAASQPMHDHEAGLTVVYNGEIYNYIELREELRAKGAKFRTQSDTEVLLKSYRFWGADCLTRFNGMFAFALWDAGAQRLLVARDRFGEKPCYLGGIPGGGLIIASEIKGILAHPAFPARPNNREVARFAAGTADPLSDETFFEGVRKLMPATASFIDAEGNIEKSWRYWTPDYEQSNGVADESACVEAFRALLTESVTQRLVRSDVQVGACLSGGLDSSTLVGILARTEQARTGAFRHTISARFDDDPTVSEGSYIDAVLEGLSLTPSAVAPTARGLVEESALLHWHQEEPFLSASIYLEWCVMRRARELGCKVMIDGQGSDELLGGYQGYFPLYQRDLLRHGNYGRLIRNTQQFNGRMKAEAAKYVNSRRRFNEAVGLSWRSLLRCALLDPDPMLPRAPGVPDSRGGHSFRHQLAYGMLYASLPVQLHSADRSAMAFGVETRFPFIDYRLVDWSVRLPDEILIRDGWQKSILRKAATGLIPDSVRWRVDKVGFAAPQDAWLRSGMKNWAEERLFSGPATKHAGYDRASIEDTWRRHLDGREDHSWKLWRWISLNEWLALFDGDYWKSGAPPARA